MMYAAVAMNVRSLSHFLALAEHLHFGQASVASNISISALSRSIRQLEEELGARLFDRDNRAVTLTRKGQKFLHYAKNTCLLYTSPSPRDGLLSRMPSSA